MPANLISSRNCWHRGHVTGPSATTTRDRVVPHSVRGISHVQAPTKTSCTAGAPGRRPYRRAGMGATVMSRPVPAACLVSPGGPGRPRRRSSPSSRRRAPGGHRADDPGRRSTPRQERRRAPDLFVVGIGERLDQHPRGLPPVRRVTTGSSLAGDDRPPGRRVQGRAAARPPGRPRRPATPQGRRGSRCPRQGGCLSEDSRARDR